MSHIIETTVAGRNMKVEYGKIGMLIRLCNIYELW